MKLWIDDVRRPPDNTYYWARSVKDAIHTIERGEDSLAMPYKGFYIELIDIDHDAGDYVKYGGDYIKVLDWLEETGRSYPIRIHSMNPVGRENMRAIIQRNGWTEVR